MDLKVERFVTSEAFENPQWKTTLSKAPQVVMSGEDYEIVPVSSKDADRVLEHLRRFFFLEEPLNIDIQLLGEHGDGKCMELENYCIETIPEGLSVMAVTTSGKVVGVSLNGSHEPGHLEEMQANADNCRHQRFQKILQLLIAVEKGADVFNRYPEINKLIEVRILSVDTEMRGKGIAKALLEKTRELATKLGYPLMRVDCTSHFSARAVARLGFECIFELKYEDYCEDGKPVFKPANPHTQVTTYVLRLEQS